MTAQRSLWAVVLAAGDGTRLAALTIDSRGNRVPKQYCSLDGGESLLHAALSRARRVVPDDRVCVIVAEQHRTFWNSSLWSVASGNVIVQPHNRGTANGVLLSVLSILRRDARARIVFLPADHHVREELKLATAVRQAINTLARDETALSLIGIIPDEPDPELGYILPGPVLTDGSRAVVKFVEKPDLPLARELIAAGALWNSLIFATSGLALLERLRLQIGWVVCGMTKALERDASVSRSASALSEFYKPLPLVDFSRTVLQGTAPSLRVIAVPRCGWSDLGTPKRVASILKCLADSDPLPASCRPQTALVNLAARQTRLDAATPGALFVNSCARTLPQRPVSSGEGPSPRPTTTRLPSVTRARGRQASRS